MHITYCPLGRRVSQVEIEHFVHTVIAEHNHPHLQLGLAAYREDTSTDA